MPRCLRAHMDRHAPHPPWLSGATACSVQPCKSVADLPPQHHSTSRGPQNPKKNTPCPQSWGAPRARREWAAARSRRTPAHPPRCTRTEHRNNTSRHDTLAEARHACVFGVNCEKCCVRGSRAARPRAEWPAAEQHENRLRGTRLNSMDGKQAGAAQQTRSTLQNAPSAPFGELGLPVAQPRPHLQQRAVGSNHTQRLRDAVR